MNGIRPFKEYKEMIDKKLIKLNKLIDDIKECGYIDCHKDDICDDTTYETILFYLQEVNKLQRIENYLDRQHDIPIEILVNIKNIIHSEDSGEE